MNCRSVAKDFGLRRPVAEAELKALMVPSWDSLEVCVPLEEGNQNPDGAVIVVTFLVDVEEIQW